MELCAVVACFALLEYLLFVIGCGRARGQYGVPAPATTGHPIFERHLRVQENTLEQIVVFLPALFLFAKYVSPVWGAGVGLVFIVGRGLYARAYIREPSKRGPGFALTLGANVALTFGALIGALHAWFPVA